MVVQQHLQGCVRPECAVQYPQGVEVCGAVAQQSLVAGRDKHLRIITAPRRMVTGHARQHRQVHQIRRVNEVGKDVVCRQVHGGFWRGYIDRVKAESGRKAIVCRAKRAREYPPQQGTARGQWFCNEILLTGRTLKDDPELSRDTCAHSCMNVAHGIFSLRKKWAVSRLQIEPTHLNGWLNGLPGRRHRATSAP